MGDLSLTDGEIDQIAGEAATLVVDRAAVDRHAQVAAAMGCLMKITRHHGLRDEKIVHLLARMFSENRRRTHG